MRLSFKFFTIAYIVTLFSVNLFGILFIQHIFDEMWETQYQQVLQSEADAINSFISYSYYYPNQITDEDLRDISLRIHSSLSKDIIKFQINITSEDDAINLGTRHFYSSNNLYYLQSTCNISIGNQLFQVLLVFDCTTLKTFQTEIWYKYSLLSVCLSLVIGMMLFYLSRKTTRSLEELSVGVESISKGNYGKLVHIKTEDLEIKKLIKRFNKMSIATKSFIDALKLEAEKQKQFVANFSHELKTPMTTILGYVELLKDYHLSEDEKHQALSSIASESRRLDKLSQELLSLFAVQNNRIELHSVYTNQLINKIDLTCQLLSQKTKIDYRINMPEVCVKANETLLLSLLYNLIDNAFKVSTKNGLVSVNGILTNNKLQIIIKDHGPGIDEAHIPHLFEPFYRIDKDRSRSKGGNGLGLALCKEIARVHNTQLKVVSEIGIGTSFFFELEMVGVTHDV